MILSITILYKQIYFDPCMERCQYYNSANEWDLNTSEISRTGASTSDAV